MNDGEIELLTRPVTPVAQLQQLFVQAEVRDVFPSGAFTIALPKLWRIDTAGAGAVPDEANPVVVLARATPGAPEAHGAEFGARVNVICALLGREINGSDWLRLWIEMNGLDTVHLRELPTAYGLMGDALALDPASGRLHRMMTVKDADMLYLIDGSADHRGQPQSPKLQEIALMAMLKFDLLDATGLEYSEDTDEVSLAATGAAATFTLPASWVETPAADAPPNGAAAHMLFIQDEIVKGTLIAAFDPGTRASAQSLEDVFLGKLTAQGFALGERLPQVEAQRGALMLEVDLQRAEGRDGPVTVLLMRASDMAGAVSLAVLGPSADSDFQVWAVNRRAFEIALETLSIARG
jgi:hypothetical protein